MSAGYGHSCALDLNGYATCWGIDWGGRLEAPEVAFSMISIGRAHGCGINLQADYFFVGESTESRAGFAVSNAGDIDGDGLDDILIGAYGSEYHAQQKAYLIYASSLDSSNVIDLSQADYSISGQAASYAHLQISLSGGSDIDGDGRAEILLTSSGFSVGTSQHGALYLLSKP